MVIKINYTAIKGNTSAVFVDSKFIYRYYYCWINLTFTNIIVCSTKTKCSSVAHNSDLGMYI